MKSQWECFLENLGEWQGSFDRFLISGELLEAVPSHLVLEEIEPQKARLTLKRDSPKYPAPLVQEYSSFNRGLLFFENGAFSQGSLQFSPIAQFGGEFGFVHRDRRLRMVQLFESDNQLKNIILIREQRVGSQAPEQPALQVDDLVGTWEGHAIALTPEWQTTTFHSTLTIERLSPDRLQQTLTFANHTLTSTAVIAGSTLHFADGAQPYQITLFPDAASATFPIVPQPGQAFFLEAGWMPEPGLRLRLIRRYDASGAWVNATLVTERKIA
ncbi:DUF3598 family protein [Alkalinema pantanalense CENA528]|uniref:DUF3598 family protein n=1 Tax=Alkalinema pantanalense TaxID=1620705 RepID=UPI003D6F3485